MIPVDGHENLARDPKSRAVINKSKKDFAEFMNERKKRKQQDSRVLELEQRIARLEQLLLS